jgi:small ligand-binding sensory domain FIST
MPFAAALSEHPLPGEAIGECVGQLLDRHGPHPDLVVLFATAPHAGAFTELAATARRLLRPEVLVGATAVSVLGGEREVEERPAVSLWGAWGLDGCRPVRMRIGRRGDDAVLEGLPADVADGPRTLLLISDPFTFPADVLLDHLAGVAPELTVVGGLASAAAMAGGNRLCVDDEIVRDGAVGVLLDHRVDTVVSQGCRPVGEPYTITRAEGNRIDELGSRPALARLQDVARDAGPDDQQLLARGVHLGRVIDEHRVTHGRGDFLIRSVMGADPDTGALVVGDRVEVGDTVQFQVRDADSADEDLHELLDGRRADGALVFTCNGRGRHLFDTDDHDAALVSALCGTREVAGMFCAGEVGPVGSRSFLHGFTASVALFHDRRRD